MICSTPKLLGIYEPDYLDQLKPKYPVYDSLDVKMTGHDYPVLESYQRFVHRIAESLDLDVSDCFAIPPSKIQVQRYKPNSAIVEADYKLTIYERFVQVSFY
jgi:large subunit ribosomal protein L48